MILIGILLYVGIIFLIYHYVLKGVENRTVDNKTYLISLFLKSLLCTICIMIPELLFDRFIIGEPKNLLQTVLKDFFRAALIEETVKMLFVSRIDKDKFSKKEYILLAGTIGAGYGLYEKLALGNGFAVILNSIVCLHLFFQMIMAYYLYEKKGVKAFAIPFVIHGLWDSILDVAYYLMEQKSPLDSVGLVMIIVAVVLGVIFEIKAVKKIKNLA